MRTNVLIKTSFRLTKIRMKCTCITILMKLLTILCMPNLLSSLITKSTTSSSCNKWLKSSQFSYNLLNKQSLLKMFKWLSPNPKLLISLPVATQTFTLSSRCKSGRTVLTQVYSSRRHQSAGLTNHSSCTRACHYLVIKSSFSVEQRISLAQPHQTRL